MFVRRLSFCSLDKHDILMAKVRQKWGIADVINFFCLSVRSINSNCVHSAVLSYQVILVCMLFYILANVHTLCLGLIPAD